MEVCYNGTYRPVCAENWNDTDAAVVCTNMGYGSPSYRKSLDLILMSKNIRYFLCSSSLQVLKLLEEQCLVYQMKLPSFKT